MTTSKVRQPKSEFKTWFESQFGKRPSRKSLEALDKEYYDTKYKLNKIEDERRLAENYQNAETAALWAWQAKGKADTAITNSK